MEDPDPPSVRGKELTSFGIQLPSAEGLIDASTSTVTVEVPAGTDLTGLVAVFTTTGSLVTVAGADQESGVTPNDFSTPLSYEVTAEDGTSKTYMVTVRAAHEASSEKSITRFGIADPAVLGVVDEAAAAIDVTVPHWTDVSSLVAIFDATGAKVTVNDTEQESGVSVNDFSNPIPYIVTAEDGSNATYTVTVRQAPGSEKELASFSILVPAAEGVIDRAAGIIRVRLAVGTDLTALIAEFSSTGVSVTLDGVRQLSGITANDFTAPREYIVTAEDGTTASYHARVTAGIRLLVNEIDYDQVGTDTAEFIELFAPGDVDLTGLVLILENGGVTPGREYSRIDLSGESTLGAGSYLVIVGPLVTVASGTRLFTPPGWTSSNRIQNGPKDAIVLFDTIGLRVVDTVTCNGTLHQAVFDGVSGEFDATEGSTGAPADSNSTVGSVGRWPDGQDTDQNGADFRFSPTPTPGSPNP
jgi:hypothetical protein